MLIYAHMHVDTVAEFTPLPFFSSSVLLWSR